MGQLADQQEGDDYQGKTKEKKTKSMRQREKEKVYLDENALGPRRDLVNWRSHVLISD